MRLKSFAVAEACLLLLATPVLAHHSFAMFDNSKWVMLKGNVVEYRWENPHMHIIVKVASGADNPATVGTWDVEGAAVNIMSRQGWTKISYKPSDPIVVVAHPLKDGTKGCSIAYAVLPDNTRRYRDTARGEGPPEDTSKTVN